MLSCSLSPKVSSYFLLIFLPLPSTFKLRRFSIGTVFSEQLFLPSLKPKPRLGESPPAGARGVGSRVRRWGTDSRRGCSGAWAGVWGLCPRREGLGVSERGSEAEGASRLLCLSPLTCRCGEGGLRGGWSWRRRDSSSSSPVDSNCGWE